MTGVDFGFEDYIRHLWRLWENYNYSILPYAKTKKGTGFNPGETVICGWAKDENTGSSFLEYVLDPEDGDGNLPIYNGQSRWTAEFDMEILLDPKATTILHPQYQTWSIDKSVRHNDWERQKDIWRLFQVEDFSITIHEIDPDAENIRGKASDISFLQGKIAGLDDEKWLKHYCFFKRQIYNRNIGNVLIYEADSAALPPYYFGPLRIGGLFFEVRLSLTVAMLSDLTNSRQADVAVRFKASLKDFNVRMLEMQESRRAPIKK